MNSFKAQVLLNKVTSANFRDPPNVKCSFTDGPSSEKIKEVFIKRHSSVKNDNIHQVFSFIDEQIYVTVLRHNKTIIHSTFIIVL